jgi:hypothetical protein
MMCDVNETLLDLSALDPRFEVVFDSTDLVDPWFARCCAIRWLRR